jgi:hypothetical protein
VRYANKVLGVAAAVIIVLAIYVAAYLANVGKAHEWAGNKVQPIPVYYVGGRFAAFIFTPAHLVDVMLSPDFWDCWQPGTFAPQDRAGDEEDRREERG